MKAKIICKENCTGHGVTFECSKCGKSIFVNMLTKRTECIRCGAKFKNVISIERGKNDIK